jgi:signal transduction histidine kinase
MKKTNSLFYHILIFTLAQLAWLSLLGLWIYWYVSNYFIINIVGERLSPQLISDSTNVFALVSGLILLVVISAGMFLIFIYLTRQVNITRLYDNFIANVTHELKSPLSSIQLHLETLDSRSVPDSKQKEFIALMKTDTDRLNNLINSILDISGLEQKKIAYNYQVYSVDEVLSEIIDEAIEQFNVPKESVIVKGHTGCRCVIDQRALKMVFNNLFDNAIKYSKEPVKINIQMGYNEKYFIVEFSDNGIGIPVRDQKRIFDKFHRIYNPNSPNVKGTGLGLYWVKEIIKYHGGNVSVSSDVQDHGSTFKIELPIYQTSKRRYLNQLLKITQRGKMNRGSNHEQQ